MKVKIKKIEGGKLPEYKRDGDVCLDCYARISGSSIEIPKGARCLVNLGFALELDEGYEAVVRPRSGLSLRGVDEVVGTIDYNYRGEVKACVINNTQSSFTVDDGDRICQLAIRQAPKIEWEIVEELSETERGADGFGSSGK